MCVIDYSPCGSMAFLEIDQNTAKLAAEELGAVRQVNTYVQQRVYSFPSGVRKRDTLFSVAYLNKDDEEVLNWISFMRSAQVFDPPREVCTELQMDAVL